MSFFSRWLAAVALLGLLACPGWAKTVRFNPMASSVGMVGDETDVQVRLHDTSGIFAYSFGIAYPAATLNVVSVSSGADMPAGCLPIVNSATDGSVCVGIACSASATITDAHLVTIRFRGEASGLAPLQFAPTTCGSSSSPACLLENDSGVSIPCAVQSGSLAVAVPTPVATPKPLRGKRSNPARDTYGCQAFWRLTNPNGALDKFGLPVSNQQCVDGDASCDFDPTPNVCAFQATLCLNNSDPALPVCTPQGISTATLLAPKIERYPKEPLFSVMQQNIAALNHAMTHLADPATPMDFSYAAPLSNAQQGFCSAPFLVRVPVTASATRPTRRSVTVRLRTSDPSLPRPHNKTTRIQLTCRVLP